MRWRDAGLGMVGAGLLGAVLAWQGGGGIGSGRLAAVGASPWQFGLALSAGAGVVAAAVLASLAAVAAARSHEGHGEETDRPLSLVRSTLLGTRHETKEDKLAG
jgi:hypothetical protein